MEELNDKDFDQIFKKKIADGYLEFEEDSWLKMEEKLRRRYRFVLYRKVSIILVFISIGIYIYIAGIKKMPNSDANVANKIFPSKERKINRPSEPLGKGEKTAEKAHTAVVSDLNTIKHNFLLVKSNSFIKKNELISITKSPVQNQNFTEDSIIKTVQNQKAKEILLPAALEEQKPIALATTLANSEKQVARKARALTLSINAGPDFSSTQKTIGGKSGLAIGIGISVPISEKLSLQSGVNYSFKNYTAKGYDYSFNNPNTVNSIAGINASCKVLEIPLRVSYILAGNYKNRLDINAGVSSYLMLKENYTFIYTASSGRKDRFLEKENANQHYLSVIDLSATYTIKLKSKKFAVGIEPYLKIPLHGIGEGSVPLKSSGISLKLNYELNKKK